MTTTPDPSAELQRLVTAGRHAEAAAFIGTLAVGRPLPPQLGLLRIQLLRAAGDVAAAAAAAAEHLRTDPGAVELLAFLCEHHASRGELAAAAPHFERATILMREALARGRTDVALDLENRFYLHYVRQRETEAHYHAAFARFVEPMAAAGRRTGAQLPPLPPPAGEGPVRMGFVLHTGFLLGHTDLLLSVLGNWVRLGIATAVPTIYVLGEVGADFAARCAALGVPLVRLRDEIVGRGMGGSVSRQLVLLRTRLAADRIDMAVWISLPVWASFAFGMRIAPVQVYWAMKFHPVDVPEIDGRVTLGNGLFDRTREIHGRTWRCGPLVVADLATRPDPAAVAAVRSGLGLPDGALLLGTIARPEKLLDPVFQESLGALMAARPHVRYVWTGRAPVPAIEEAFARQGIADRCHFVGWVDTKVYAAALDLFVEPFPFGCGVTGLHAIAAGTPILAMDIPDSAYGLTVGPALAPDGPVDPGTVAALRAIYAPYLETGAPLVAGTPDAYVEAGLRLIDDADLRRRLGAANAAFAAAYLFDMGPAALAFLDHFLAIHRTRAGAAAGA